MRPHKIIRCNHKHVQTSQLKERCRMLETTRTFCVYSFNLGPAHIVSFSSEYYYYTNYGWKQIANQYKWVENDLKVGLVT